MCSYGTLKKKFGSIYYVNEKVTSLQCIYLCISMYIFFGGGTWKCGSSHVHLYREIYETPVIKNLPVHTQEQYIGKVYHHSY